MYLASDFNEAGLFSRAASWIDAEPIDPSGRPRTMSLLLHRASAAFLYLRRMEILSLACKERFERVKQRLALGTTRISFWSPELAEMLSDLSPFFSAMVILQNSLIMAIGAQAGRTGTLPNSLHDLIKKSTHYSWLDNRVLRVLIDYWEQAGKRLRDYRDVDQHFHILTQHSFLDLTVEPRVRVILPDNPESKSPRIFTFAKGIDALEYCPAEFRRLHETVETVAEVFGYTPSKLQQPLNLHEPYQVAPTDQGRTVALVFQTFGQYEGIELGQAAGESTMFVRQLAKNADS